jgi:hypothetical protein
VAAFFRRAWNVITGVFRTLNTAHRDQVVSLTQYEARELENIFVLLLLGSFAGMPAPPTFISAELLPYLEHEIRVLNRRAEQSSDVLAEVMGAIDADA